MASATANQDQVKVNGSLYLPWVLVKSEAATQSKFTAMIRVEAPPSSEHSNSPIHLVVVLDLDVCGQQQQEKAGGPGWLLDLLKTMKFIRGKLRETKDPIDVVDAFNGLHMNIDACISVAQAGKRDPESCRTELKELLRSAAQILKNRKSPVGFILLLSDGQSKLTESDSRALLAKELVGSDGSKCRVHAFGLGINHDDPGMLHRIAQGCSGTYSSIARADNLNDSKQPLMEAVALCLGGLKSVVAINTRVKIGVKLDDPNSAGDLMTKKSIKIKVQPRADDSSKSKNEGFLIGDGVLYAGEVKDLIVDIDFSTIKNTSRTRSATLTATVEYRDSTSHKEAPPVNCTLPLLVTGTSNWPALNAYNELEKLLPNSLVLQRMIRFELLEKLVEFAGKLSTKKQKTPATRPMTPQTTTTGDLLQTMWDNLKKQGKTLQVAQKMGNLVDLRGIDNDMKAMASCLQREGVSSGLSCIYSWVSSYKMQRATTMGLQLPANPFLTPAMEAMVLNARNKQLVARNEPSPSQPVQQEGAVEMADKQDDAAVPPSPPVVEENTTETGKPDDTAVAQKEPSPSQPVQQEGAVEVGKQDDATVPLSPPVVEENTAETGNQDDEKAKLAIRLMDDIDGRFQLFEDIVTSLNISMSEGNQMSDIDRRKVLELFKDQMHQAAKKAIEEWRKLKATSSSSSVNDDSTS